MFEDAAKDMTGIEAVDNGFEMEGETTVSTIRRVTGLPVDDPLMTTIAGKALRAFGRVPKVGDQIEVDGLVLTVLEMDGLRIARVRLERNGFSETDSGVSD